MPRNRGQAQVDRSPSLIYQDYNGDQTTVPEGQLESRSRLLGALRCLARGNDGPASPDAAAAQLQAFAEENGFVLATETFRRTVVGSHKERPELASGSEHTVWFDNATKRVIKLTHPDLAGDGSVGQSDLIGYLKSLYLQNQLFQDDIRLEGIVSLDGQFPQVVISQPFVKGREATAAEISMFMEQRGFRSKDGAWHNGAVTVSDAVRHNVMAADTRDGSLTVVPFDLQVSEL